MTRILVKFLEEIGMLSFRLQTQKQLILSHPHATAENVMSLISNQLTPITIDIFEKYLQKVGMLPSKDELQHLFSSFDVCKQGHITLQCISTVFNFYQTQRTLDSMMIQAQLDSLLESYVRINLAGYRQLRKIRRIMLSYDTMTWAEWLNLIWSRQQGRVSLEELELFLKAEHVGSQIIEGLIILLKSEGVEELAENSLKSLIAPYSYPVPNTLRTNSGLRTQRVIRNIQRLTLQESSQVNKVEKAKSINHIYWSNTNSSANHDMKSQVRLDNKEQLHFYVKLHDFQQKRNKAVDQVILLERHPVKSTNELIFDP